MPKMGLAFGKMCTEPYFVDLETGTHVQSKAGSKVEGPPRGEPSIL